MRINSRESIEFNASEIRLERVTELTGLLASEQLRQTPIVETV